MSIDPNDAVRALVSEMLTEAAMSTWLPPRAAAYLGLHTATLRKLVRNGRIQCFSAGKFRRFHRVEHLDAYVRSLGAP